MFGYVKICKPELRIKEYEMYKAVYCSLCRYLGKEYGIVARMMLNYDFTFLSLLLMALQENTVTVERKCCVCNPLKKCNYCAGDSAALDLPAAALVILADCKNKDNIFDERGIKRIGSILLAPLLKHPCKKATKKYPQIAAFARDYMAEQKQTEAENCRDLDMAAAPSGKFLARLFEFSGESGKRVLFELGEKLGRYVYVTDAVCDYKEDIKNKRYNPLDGKEDTFERARANISYCIAGACAAFELLDIKKFKNILGNILYAGLEDVMERELKKQ